jgi:hypothetical protein
MKKQLLSYIRFLEEDLPGRRAGELPSLWEQYKAKAEDFRHERLVHLIVTLFFAFLTLVCFTFCLLITTSASFAEEALNPLSVVLLFALTFVLIIVDVFYIRHYFILENGLQYIYTFESRFFPAPETTAIGDVTAETDGTTQERNAGVNQEELSAAGSPND